MYLQRKLYKSAATIIYQSFILDNSYMYHNFIEIKDNM